MPRFWKLLYRTTDDTHGQSEFMEGALPMVERWQWSILEEPTTNIEEIQDLELIVS